MPGGSTKQREAAARAIADGAKAVRKPLPRGLWLAAAILGGACAIAAAILFTRTPDRTTTPAPVENHDRFALGIGLGLAGGIVIGLALGRRRGPTPDA